jgi:hypothetical protein
MITRLALDDDPRRWPRWRGTFIAQTVDEAVALLTENTQVTEVSLDYDLYHGPDGLARTGMDLARWLAENRPQVLVTVHSRNWRKLGHLRLFLFCRQAGMRVRSRVFPLGLG